MKKILAFTLAVMGIFTACGSGKPDATADNYNYKTGLATYTHTNNTYGTTSDKNGQSAVSTTIVAAVFDNNGKIVDIKIDEVESKTGFDNAGRLVGYTGNEVMSKKEQGDSYGMKAASGIGKEWYQQIETLEKRLVGKDVNTVIMPGARMGYGAGMNDDYNTYDQWNGAGYDNWNNNGTAPRNGTNSRVPYSNSGSGNTAGDMVGDAIDGINSAIDDATDGIMDGTTSGNTTGNSGVNSSNRNSSGSSSSGTNSGAGFWNSSDITAGVTIDTTYIQRAIEKAYRNAK